MKNSFFAACVFAALLGSCCGGGRKTTDAGKNLYPEPNLYLSAPVYGVSHFNPAQTDAFPYAVGRGEFGVDLQKMPIIYSGPINIMTLASTDSTYMWAVSTDRVNYVDCSGRRWASVAEMGLPGVRQVSADGLKKLVGQNYRSVEQIESVVKEVLGDWPPAIKAGTGSGTTPTLMGFGNDPDKLVVITDGNNRMNIVAFWRDEIPSDFERIPGTKSRRIAGQMPVTAGQPRDKEWIQSEQSVVVGGYGEFVVNNVITDGLPDKVLDAMAVGQVIAPPRGVERFEWDPAAHAWKSVWSRGDVISISTVPAVSTASDIVFVNGYTPGQGWDVTGLDWNGGQTVTRALFGHDNLGNGAYSILQFLPDGDMLFNSIAGTIRFPMK